MSSIVSISAPWSWPPSTYWDGNDGLWSTFIVQVGTPPQTFRVLPSTDGQETWVLNPQGCTKNDPSNCTASRGAFNGGFDTSNSSTWQAIGLYDLDEQEQDLGYYGNGLYGFDTVVIGDHFNLTKQVVAGIADKDFYIGLFGIGPKTINFTTFNDPLPNYMSNLITANAIPSRTFGYTAGAYYRNASASLTLGGYDTSRFTSTQINFGMNSNNSIPLQVGVRKVIAVNTLSGTSNLLPTACFEYIDSAVPHIWLPADAIKAFTTAFGLQYDNQTDLFLINDTMRALHLQNKPTITFFLGDNLQDGTTASQTIVLPYSAFDKQASYPFYSTPKNYFPIRIAHNEWQQTMGRTFLQEAYLIADWDRQNFTVAQTTFDNLNSPSLIPILNATETSALNQSQNTPTSAPLPSALNTGVIVGIVIGSVVAVAVMLALLIFIRRRVQRSRALRSAYPKDKKESVDGDDSAPDETKWDATKWERYGAHEMPSSSEVVQAASVELRSAIYELPVPAAELAADGRRPTRYALHDAPYELASPVEVASELASPIEPARDR